jgi:hypothetical protein
LTKKKYQNFGLLFEQACSIIDSKAVLKIDIESPDLLLSQAMISDLEKNSRKHFLIIPKKIKFPELESKGFTEDIILSITLFKCIPDVQKNDTFNVKKISETLKINITNEKFKSGLFTVNFLEKNIFVLFKFYR